MFEIQSEERDKTETAIVLFQVVAPPFPDNVKVIIEGGISIRMVYVAGLPGFLAPWGPPVRRLALKKLLPR